MKIIEIKGGSRLDADALRSLVFRLHYTSVLTATGLSLDQLAELLSKFAAQSKRSFPLVVLCDHCADDAEKLLTAFDWPESVAFITKDPVMVPRNADDVLEQAARLISTATQAGVVVTITLKPLTPLAMGHHAYHIDMRPLRGSTAPPVFTDGLKELLEIKRVTMCVADAWPDLATDSHTVRHVKWMARLINEMVKTQGSEKTDSVYDPEAAAEALAIVAWKQHGGTDASWNRSSRAQRDGYRRVAWAVWDAVPKGRPWHHEPKSSTTPPAFDLASPVKDGGQ